MKFDYTKKTNLKTKIMTLEIAIFLAIPFIGLIAFAGLCDYVNAKINKVETNKK